MTAGAVERRCLSEWPQYGRSPTPQKGAGAVSPAQGWTPRTDLSTPASAGSGRFCAPSGLSDSDEDSDAESTGAVGECYGEFAATSARGAAPVSPGRVVFAPPGGSDSEDDDAGLYGGLRPPAEWSRREGVRSLTAAELALQDWQEEQKREVQLASQHRELKLRLQMMGPALDDAQEAISIYTAVRKQHEDLLIRDADEQQRLYQMRQKTLSAEQSRHQMKLQRHAADLRRAEEERIAKERERQRRLELEKQQREQEALRLAEAQKAKEAQQRAQAQAQQEQARAKEAAASSAKAAEDAAAAKAKAESISEGGFKVRISASAYEWQKRCAKKIEENSAALAAYEGNDSLKKQRRALEKEVTKFVVQISATKDQIMAKTSDLVELINARCSDDVQRTFVLQTLAKKVLKQCENQVARNNDFAFALGEVVVHLMAAFPVFIELLVGHMHKSCILTVPKYYVYKTGTGTDDAYFRQMGYKETPEEEKASQGPWETTDAFLFRSLGYVYLYAAITQVDVNPHPHGLECGWEYLARLLNRLPANRTTATALHAFIKVAGYKMYHVYKGQFVKLLSYVHDEFLPELEKCTDPDAKAVHSRLELYLNERAYTSPPEGREIPQCDESKHTN